MMEQNSSPKQSEPHLPAQPVTTEVEHKKVGSQEAQRSQTALGLAQQRHSHEQAHQSQHQRQGKRIADGLPGCTVAHLDADRFANLVAGSLTIGHNDLLRAVLT